MLAKVAEALGDDFDEKAMGHLFCEIATTKKDGAVVTMKDRLGQEKSYVQVPVKTSDESFRKQKGWLRSTVKINGTRDGHEYDAARRFCLNLAKDYPEPMMDALKQANYPVVEYMNETKLAAMFEDAGLNLSQERALLQHMRDHFGKKAFATRKKVQMLCEGHTPVSTGSVKHAYVKGEVEETLEYSNKDIPLEVATQMHGGCKA